MATLFDKLREGAKTRLQDAQARLESIGADAGVDKWVEELGDRLRSYESRLVDAQRTMTPEYQAKVARWYARLELPHGASAAEVRVAYRALMRRYHPDRFTGDPGLEHMATRLSQELSVAHDGLLAYLERRTL